MGVVVDVPVKGSLTVGRVLDLHSWLPLRLDAYLHAAMSLIVDRRVSNLA